MRTTREGLQRVLVDLGWVTLIHRALGGKPAETYALRQLLRCAGRPVAVDAIAAEYDVLAPGKTVTGSYNAVLKRIERVRAALADLGCGDAIQTCVGEAAYLVEPGDAARIEAALLFANGVEVVEGDGPRPPLALVASRGA